MISTLISHSIYFSQYCHPGESVQSSCTSAELRRSRMVKRTSMHLQTLYADSAILLQCSIRNIKIRQRYLRILVYQQLKDDQVLRQPQGLATFPCRNTAVACHNSTAPTWTHATPRTL